MYNGNNANAQQRQAQADVFALQSGQALPTSLQSADLLALAGWQESHTETALGSLLSREADPYLGSFPEPPDYVVTSLAISSDWTLLAVGGFPTAGSGVTAASTRNASVQLWNMLSRREVAVFPADGEVHDIAFSPDATTLAAAVLGRSLRLWNVATRKAVPNPTGDTGRVSALGYSPDGRLMAVAQGPTHVIDLWELASHRLIARLSGHTGFVWSLAFSPDGRTLASGSADGTARLWNVAAGTGRSILRPGSGAVQQVEFSPDGPRIALAAASGSVWDWDIATGSSFVPNGLNFGPGNTPSVVFDHGGQYLYALDPPRNQLHVENLVYNADTIVSLGQQAGPALLASNPAGTTLVLGGFGDAILAYDVGHRTFNEGSSLFGITLSPDGRVAATGADDGTVRLWDPASPSAPARVLSTGQNSADTLPVAFSPDGRLLATGGPGAAVIFWNAVSGTKTTTLTQPSAPEDTPSAETVALGPDGRTLASYSTEGIAAVWDVATGRRIAVFHVPVAAGGLAAGMAYSPDGRLLATGGAGTNEVKALCGAWQNKRFAIQWRDLSRDRCPGGPARPRQEPRRRGDGHPDARHERHRSHPDDHSRRRSGTCRHPHHLR